MYKILPLLLFSCLSNSIKVVPPYSETSIEKILNPKQTLTISSNSKLEVKGIVLTPSTKGNWKRVSNRYTFTPYDSWKIAHKYKININGEIHSFSIPYLSILKKESYFKKGAVHFKLSFNMPLNKESFQNKVLVEELTYKNNDLKKRRNIPFQYVLSDNNYSIEVYTEKSLISNQNKAIKLTIKKDVSTSYGKAGLNHEAYIFQNL